MLIEINKQKQYSQVQLDTKLLCRQRSVNDAGRNWTRFVLSKLLGVMTAFTVTELQHQHCELQTTSNGQYKLNKNRYENLYSIHTHETVYLQTFGNMTTALASSENHQKHFYLSRKATAPCDSSIRALSRHLTFQHKPSGPKNEANTHFCLYLSNAFYTFIQWFHLCFHARQNLKDCNKCE